MADLPALAEPVIGCGARFEGLLQLRQEARIDGAVRGDIVSDSPIWLGETACVDARIVAREVVVAGELRGSVAASVRIQLLATARVRAELSAPRVAFAEGAYFEGRCRTGGTSEG
jgi:cytoskeletal protein CcmA (bactofilin family)